MKLSLGLKRNQRIVALFCLLGIITTGAELTYLMVTAPHWQQRNPKAEALFEAICPFGILTAVFVDSPGTKAEEAVCWAVISILNAGLYGLIGSIVMRLTERSQRMWPRAGLIASLAALLVGMIPVMSGWTFICFWIAFLCLGAVSLYNLWSPFLEMGKHGDGRPSA